MNYLTPIPKQFSDQSGTPYSYGKVYVYVAGTSELANIYKEADSDVLAENPYTLDVAGSWQCFVPVSTPLDYIVTDTDNNTVFSFKNVSVPSDEGSGASVSKAYVDTQDRALGARISNLAADVDDEVARAEAAEKAAKTEVVEGENIRVEETIAPDGHSIFEVSSDGAPQQQSNWTQQAPSEPDYIKNKPTKLSDFTDDVTRQSLVESGVGIEKPVSSAAVNAGLSEKADKVTGATEGNFAELDANGNITDSGKNSADFATASQGDKADTAVQGVKANGTLLTPDTNNVVNITSESIGLGNVDNTSDDEKKSSFTGAIEPMNTGFATGGDVYDAIAESEAKTGSIGFLSGTGKESVVTKDTAFHALPVDSVKLFFSGDFFDLDDGILSLGKGVYSFSVKFSIDRENLEDYEPSNEIQLVSFYVGGKMFTVNLDRSIELPAESVCFSGMVLITEDDTDFEIKVKTSSIDLLSVNLDSISLVKMNHMTIVKKRAYLITSDNKFVITDDGKRIFSEYNV